MVKKIALLLIPIFLIALSGCATARKQKDLEIQGLKNQVSALQAQLETKEDEVNTLREALNKAREGKPTATKGMGKKKIAGEIKSRPTVKHIQIALKNAGYNPGSLDGRMGRQTRDAIRAFQRANNLPVDGRVGKQTWDLLKEYLYKKVK